MKKYYVSYSWTNFSSGGLGSRIFKLKKLNFAGICILQKKIEKNMEKEYGNLNVVILNIIELEDDSE